jgi:hypothetical protein
MNQQAKTKPHFQDTKLSKDNYHTAEDTGKPILVFECAALRQAQGKSRDPPYVIQAICAKVQNRGWLSYGTSVWVSSRGGSTGPGPRLWAFDEYEVVSFG